MSAPISRPATIPPLDLTRISLNSKDPTDLPRTFSDDGASIEESHPPTPIAARLKNSEAAAAASSTSPEPDEPSTA